MRLNLGATNHRDRYVLELSSQFTERVSSQALVYQESGHSPTLGANMTAWLSDAATAHMEFTRGSEPDLLSRALGFPATDVTRTSGVHGHFVLTCDENFKGSKMQRLTAG